MLLNLNNPEPRLVQINEILLYCGILKYIVEKAFFSHCFSSVTTLFRKNHQSGCFQLVIFKTHFLTQVFHIFSYYEKFIGQLGLIIIKQDGHQVAPVRITPLPCDSQMYLCRLTRQVSIVNKSTRHYNQQNLHAGNGKDVQELGERLAQHGVLAESSRAVQDTVLDDGEQTAGHSVPDVLRSVPHAQRERCQHLHLLLPIQHKTKAVIKVKINFIFTKKRER